MWIHTAVLVFNSDAQILLLSHLPSLKVSSKLSDDKEECNPSVIMWEVSMTRPHITPFCFWRIEIKIKVYAHHIIVVVIDSVVVLLLDC